MSRSVALFALVATLLAGCSNMRMAPGSGGAAVTKPDLIVVRQTTKTPEEAVSAIKAFTESKKWVYFGALTVRPPQGPVTMLKVCIPSIAAMLWPAGLEVSAILPCGNFGVYQKEGRTHIAMLDPQYMHVLMPRPEVERASAAARPLFDELLDHVVR